MPFEFPTEVEAIDAVPDFARSLYVQDGDNGRFHIHADFKGHVAGLVSALDKERKANKDGKSKLQNWLALGETPEVVSAKIEELTQQITASSEGKANWDKMKKDLEDGFRKDLDKAETKNKLMKQSLENYLIDSEATKVIAELKGSPMLLLPHIRSQVKVFEDNGQFEVKVVDKEGDPRGNGKGGFMTIRELIVEMKNSDSFGRAFDAANKQGGGTPPGKQSGGAGNTGQKTSVQKISAGLAARGR